jgi:hypothetical protein
MSFVTPLQQEALNTARLLAEKEGETWSDFAEALALRDVAGSATPSGVDIYFKVAAIRAGIKAENPNISEATLATLSPPPVEYVFTLADLNVVAGIRTSVATATAPQSYTGDALDGSMLSAGSIKYIPRTVTVTSTAQVGAYKLAEPIVVAGMLGGLAIAENIFLTAVNGGETVRGVQAFDSITEINVPAMASVSGSLQVGVGDLCGAHRGWSACVELQAVSNGVICVSSDENGVNVSVLRVTAGRTQYVHPLRILTDPTLTNPTNVGFSIIYIY